MSNLIDDIKQDHRELEEYYQNYKQNTNINHDEANKWFHAFTLELSRHAVAEELVLYPLMEKLNEKGRLLAKESREEHEKTKQVLYKLQNMSNSVDFDATFDSLFSDLKSHIEKEETEDLQFIQDSLTPEQLEKASKKFTLRKKIVPTRPHPNIPDKPATIEAMLGLLVSPIDKFKDLFTPFPDNVE
jgi:hemerythrin-like domain-containing protein